MRTAFRMTQEAWMELRAMRALREAGATWKEIGETGERPRSP